MKRFSCLAILCIFYSGPNLFAQDITLSADSVQKLLCKKWQVSYALLGGMKIFPNAEAPEMNFEFKKDKTFLMTSNDPTNKRKGTWNYIPAKKLIQLIVDGRKDQTIVSLKDEELVMVMDMKNATPDDPEPIKTVFKARTE